MRQLYVLHRIGMSLRSYKYDISCAAYCMVLFFSLKSGILLL